MAALRLNGPAPAYLERVVPDSLSSPFEILGYALPPGTIIGTQSWSTHSTEEVFPNAKEFVVERWLGKNETDDMKANMMPFGHGRTYSAPSSGTFRVDPEIFFWVFSAYLRGSKVSSASVERVDEALTSSRLTA